MELKLPAHCRQAEPAGNALAVAVQAGSAIAMLSLSGAPHVVFLRFPPTLTPSGIYLESAQIHDTAILSLTEQ